MVSQVSPPITVAVPTCNGATHLAETLLSILSQEGVPFDLIISDDRSDDETLDVVRAVVGDQARIVVNSERLGLAGNWNQCVALCLTPFIAIVHQDDLLSSGHLAGHLAAFLKDPCVGLVASASTSIDNEGRDIPDPAARGGLGPIDKVFSPGEVAEQMVRCDNPFRCSGVSIRTDAHADVGGFSPRYSYVLDWDFWLRVSRKWRVAWLANPTVKTLSHSGNETARLYRKHRTDLTLFNECKCVFDNLFDRDLAGHPRLADFRREVNLRLARDLLNWSQFALWDGQVELANECLLKAFGLSPRILGPILMNYRLGIKMGVLALAPGIAGRLFSRAR